MNRIDKEILATSEYSETLLLHLANSGVSMKMACMVGLMLACRAIRLGLTPLPEDEQMAHLIEGLHAAYPTVKAGL